MRKISKDGLKKAYALINESGLMTMAPTKGVLFFPAEAPERVHERETGVILVETRKEGSAALVKPGLIVTIAEKQNVPSILFGYASVEYGVPFLIAEYQEMTGDAGFLSADESAELADLECIALDRSAVLVAFEMGAEMGVARD
jgi:hypothetical protein